MALTVLNVAYPLAPVGRDAVGGAEQVLAHIDAALAGAGHRSLVVAAAGSDVRGTLLAVPRIDGPLDAAAHACAHANHRRAIADALDRYPVDLVHLHGIDFADYLPAPGVPVLATLHLPPSWYPGHALHPDRPRTWLNCVSESQHAACPPGAALLAPVPNGIPVEDYANIHARRGFAFALGRICPEKGFHTALDAARRAGRPLLLAGQVYGYAAHRDYFRNEIEPRLDRLRRFIGPVGLVRKRRLMSAARCLVVPSLVAETSSLVAMEALACGTPVVARRIGALPDIVEPGRTGFLVDDEASMAEAMEAAGALSANECRAAARERFSVEVMTRRYLDLYHELRNRPA